MFVTLFDSCMIALAALIVWRINPFFVFFPWLTIALLDGLFLSSALEKVPDGAWFTITLASILAGIFILWRFGKEQQWAAEAQDRFPTTHLVKVGKDGQIRLTKKYGGYDLSTIKGLGIFFDKAGEMTPAIFIQFVSKLIAAPEVIVFFHLRPLETPTVTENRYTVSRLAIPNCYRLIVRHGYMDEVVTKNLSPLVFEQVRDFVIRQGAPSTISSTPSSPQEQETTLPVAAVAAEEKHEHTTVSSLDIEGETRKSDASIAAELAKLQEAYDRQVLYIVGKEEMKVKAGTKIWRRVLLYIFLWLRDNTRTKIANLGIPTDRVIEVGFVKEV